MREDREIAVSLPAPEARHGLEKDGCPLARRGGLPRAPAGGREPGEGLRWALPPLQGGRKARISALRVEAGRERIDSYIERFEKVKLELSQIADALSVRGFLETFKNRLIEFSENPICHAALLAGRDFKNKLDGKRAEKVLENGAREKLDELNSLGDEMYSPFEEIGQLREASKRLEGTRGFDRESKSHRGR